MTIYKSYIHEYLDRIEVGEIVAGKLIKDLYHKIVEGISLGVYFFSFEKADKAITFIENFCHHCKGRNDLIKLELWQKALISTMFGVLDSEGKRQFREVYIVVGRKNGKSALASAIANYMAYLDGEYGAELYCLAPKLDQAAIVYGSIYQQILAEPELSELAKKRRSDIYLGETNTIIKPLAFNAKKSDGFNPHLVICDEIASWPPAQGLKQYEVMKSALGARTQPMILSISTAGYINDGIYDELMKRATSWLKGSSKESRLLPVLYIVDDPDRWNDIDELRKANPNIGVSIQPSFFAEEIAVAEVSQSKKNEFLCKYCNIKQSDVAAWLPQKLIMLNFDCKKLEEFRNHYCVGGIDLSQTTDLTSACVVIEKNSVLYVFSKFFMPARKVEELTAREGVPYASYISQGFVQISGENYVDYNDVFNWFRSLIEIYKIYPLKVGYDRYSSQYLVLQMSEYGFHMDDVFQGENLTPVIKECEGIIRDGKLNLGENNLLKAHFLNVALKQNFETRKVRPVKIEERCHIDGFVAVIDALTVRQKYNNEIGRQLMNAG